LLLKEIWEGGVERVGPRGQVVLNVLFVVVELLRDLLSLLSALAISENVIDLLDQVLVGGDVVKQAFWNKHAPVVLALHCSINNDIAEFVNDIDEGLSTG
jgi:hypothetical protein